MAEFLIVALQLLRIHDPINQSTKQNMALTVNALLGNPGFHDFILEQTTAFLNIHRTDPKLASIFGTHQRWMLAHVGMAQYFLDALSGASEPVIVMARYLEQVRRYEIASVNTADSFLKEMVVYGIALHATTGDRRHKPVIPAPRALETLRHWVGIHLHTLDGIDGGNRLDRFEHDPGLLWHLHPQITERLLNTPSIRIPPPRYGLFTWLNSGGVLVDWLMTSVKGSEVVDGHFLTQVRSVPRLAEMFRISRTHLTRKLREAEDMGSIGWLGQRGRSTMWISKALVDEYSFYQAQKLSAIDEAFEEVAGPPMILSAMQT